MKILQNIKLDKENRLGLLLVGLSILLFLGSRIWLTFFFEIDPSYSDIHHYTAYAYENEWGKINGANIYESRIEAYNQSNISAKMQGKDAYPEYKKIIEYPPLSVEWIKFQALFINDDITEFTPKTFTDYWEKYRDIFRKNSALLDLLIFIVFMVLLFKLYPDESMWEKTERILILSLAGFIMGYLIYNRLDIAMTFLLFVSFALLISRYHFIWSYLLFALAVCFKIVPIVLFPVWIIGSLPSKIFFEENSLKKYKRILLQIIGKSLILVGIIVIIFLPFILIYGSVCMIGKKKEKINWL